MLPGLRKINAGGFSVVPKKYGGNGFSAVDANVILMEMNKHDASFGVF
jgi:alkylation response protein AidB-like acyl-CoA dehydrogenase